MTSSMHPPPRPHAERTRLAGHSDKLQIYKPQIHKSIQIGKKENARENIASSNIIVKFLESWSISFKNFLKSSLVTHNKATWLKRIFNSFYNTQQLNDDEEMAFPTCNFHFARFAQNFSFKCKENVCNKCVWKKGVEIVLKFLSYT